MRPNISEILTSIPTRLWMFALFLSGSVLSIVLQRAADAWVPPGTEATQFRSGCALGRGHNSQLARVSVGGRGLPPPGPISGKGHG